VIDSLAHHQLNFLMLEWNFPSWNSDNPPNTFMIKLPWNDQTYGCLMLCFFVSQWCLHLLVFPKSSHSVTSTLWLMIPKFHVWRPDILLFPFLEGKFFVTQFSYQFSWNILMYTSYLRLKLIRLIRLID